MTTHGPRIPALAAFVAIQLMSGVGLRAQQASPLPPIRQIGRRLAIAPDTLGGVSGIRQLADGRVIVNDVIKRRLLLLDSTLKHTTVIADSTGATQKAYGGTQGGIIAARGDTTYFVDPIALSLVVIDPHGSIVKTIAPPRPADAPALSMSVSNAGVDAAGHVVYRSVRAFCSASFGCSYGIGGSAPDTAALRRSVLPLWAMHDSVAILRGTIATQTIDTIGFVAIPFVGGGHVTRNPDGSTTFTREMTTPIPLTDVWTVVGDGSVAFVRGLDYHIDWINADGSHTSTPKIAHDWRRLSDSEKTWILDSAKRYSDSANKLNDARQAKQDSITRASGAVVPNRGTTVMVWPDPADFPDYRPPLTQYAIVKGDADGNLWIQQGGMPSSPLGPGSPLLFDVVNRQGVLIDRVQLPPTLSLAGFGPGVVYLTSREGAGTVLLKYRIH